MDMVFKMIWTIAISVFIMNRVVTPFLRAITNRSKNAVKQEEESDFEKQEVNIEKMEALHSIEMVKDSYCNTYVQKEKAFQVVNSEGTIHYFCSYKI